MNLLIILGHKTFRNSLAAKKVRSLGKIDGVDTKNIITLSSNQQEIPGTITFKDIEVVQELNVSKERKWTDMYYSEKVALEVQGFKI